MKTRLHSVRKTREACKNSDRLGGYWVGDYLSGYKKFSQKRKMWITQSHWLVGSDAQRRCCLKREQLEACRE